ncbi:Transcriptional repressor NrdR like [Actinidia chinensis var. chinensis]|uniref:Uncharacterized protein n=2 Tax=Actinidia TaxID=3624 RepID=A0A7J0GZ07_9ERIC|nr:Transcriptional repressor NrdR like [Actinidia chinensis var. chinensis]GFZ16032.1 hypothetical protein Acr_25g0004410 [Actinidia rufa]GFZ16037.1 hypothetical protein Acr_25g0004460 [Actinidia rufa]
MDIVPASYFENLKRYWRRKKYQRLDDSNGRKRLKVMRLGGKARRVWKIRLIPKLKFKLVTKFHEAYVNMMIAIMGDKDKGLYGMKKVPKDRPVPIVSSNSNQVVDGRMVLEIYKRLVSTRELAGLLV